MPRADDEHMNVPTWRMRQLQDVEDAARQCVELIVQTRPMLLAASRSSWDPVLRAAGEDSPAQISSGWDALVVQVRDLLAEALND